MATARDLTSGGLGVVADATGRVYFVPGVWPGEEGEFEVTALRGRVGEARLTDLRRAAAERIAPSCPYHGSDEQSCGGCPWMFMSYQAQLAAKAQRVAQALAAHTEADIAPIWAAPEALGYRNRAQLKTDGRRLGYMAARSRRLAEVDDCLVLNAHNRSTLQSLRAQLPRDDWQPASGRGWSTLHIDDDVNPDAVVADVRRPFRQGNSAQNARMQRWLLDTLRALRSDGDPPAIGPVLELFAGSGNFTAVLVEAGCTEIHAVDSFSPAVDDLARQALPGVTTQAIDLNRADAAEQLAPQLTAAQLLLLDPPREGLKALGEFLDRAGAVRHILYVSCDVATCARDIEAAAARGFSLRTVQPLDLFPQTPHVELLCVLQRAARPRR